MLLGVDARLGPYSVTAKLGVSIAVVQDERGPLLSF